MIVECKDDQMILRAESPLECYYFRHFFNSSMAWVSKDEDCLGIETNTIRLMPVKEMSDQLKN
jgi:hypothetical protein